jgi:hypothetical protein
VLHSLSIAAGLPQRIDYTPREAESVTLSLRLIYGAVADELRLASGVKFTTKGVGVKGGCYRASADSSFSPSEAEIR